MKRGARQHADSYFEVVKDPAKRSAHAKCKHAKLSQSDQINIIHNIE